MYPEEAKLAAVQGNVVLECLIDETGQVAWVRVLTGHPLLSAAAVNAVKQWSYSPPLLKDLLAAPEGVPVPVVLKVSVPFRLPRARPYAK